MDLGAGFTLKHGDVGAFTDAWLLVCVPVGNRACDVQLLLLMALTCM